MKVMGLEPQDMHILDNLEFLGIAVNKKGEGRGVSYARKFRPRHGGGAEEEGEDDMLLTRYSPLMRDLVDDLANGKLSFDDYPSVTEDPEEVARKEREKQERERAESSFAIRKVGSVRTYRSARSAAFPRKAEGSFPGADLIHQVVKRRADPSKIAQARKLVVFVVGGMLRSELRTAHQATEVGTGEREALLAWSASTVPSSLQGLAREVIIGSTSVETPKTFLDQVFELTPYDKEDFAD